jgi:hypothetical protein
MSILPDYDVIIWINHNKFGEKLEKDILSSVDIEPYDRNEYDDFLDMHWGFENWYDALKFADNLLKFHKNPNVIFMKASNSKNPDASIVYKDEK